MDVLGPPAGPTLGVESVAGVEAVVEVAGVEPPAVDPLCVESGVAGALESAVAGVALEAVPCVVASVPGVVASVLVAVAGAEVVASDAGVVASAAGPLESVLGVVAVAGVVVCPVWPAEVCAGASVDGVPVGAGVDAGVDSTGAASRTECACGPLAPAVLL
jgi:hypothetical protein